MRLMLRHARRNAGRVWGDGLYTLRLCKLLRRRGWVRYVGPIHEALRPEPVHLHELTDAGRRAT